MEQIIIISNIGSTSKKYSIYKNDRDFAWFHFEKKGEEIILSSKISAHFEKKHVSIDIYQNSLTYIRNILSTDDISCVVIRAVVPHEDFVRDMFCNETILKTLHEIAHQDPAHINLLIEEIEEAKSFISIDSILLVSDSGFHQKTKRKIPLSFDVPVYSVGYHGLSCESVLHILSKNNIARSKTIIAHLGGGSSISGIYNSRSVFNSMEFSPLGGMIMSSRSGSVDPFLILKYMNEKKLSYEQTIEHLYTQSGLYALSGISSDLRSVREHALAGNQNAKQAISTFVDSIVSTILQAGSYTQGFETLIFTGTIGIRASYIREFVCEKLLWLGCILDHRKNNELNDECVEISTFDSKIKIYVVQIDEMKEMYNHVKNFLKNNI